MLKGGHEAPTKPKGRPKKNSIPTTEEIEAEERRMRMEEEERMRRGREEAARSEGGEQSLLEPQDLSADSHSPFKAMDPNPEQERPLLMTESHAAS